MDLQHHPVRHSHCSCCGRELKMTTTPPTIMFSPVPSPIVSAVFFPSCFLLPTSKHLLSSISCPFDTRAQAWLYQTWRLTPNWLDLMAEKIRVMLLLTWLRSSQTTDLIVTLVVTWNRHGSWAGWAGNRPMATRPMGYGQVAGIY